MDRWFCILILSVSCAAISPHLLIAAEQTKGQMLLEAVAKGQQKKTEVLINSKEIDLERRDELGRTPLLLSVVTNNHAIAKLLVDAKADINAQDKLGRTALMHALMSGDKEMFKMLLDQKVNLEIHNESGETALIIALKKRDKELIKYLLDKGANINNVDNDGWTALFYAVTSGNIDIEEVNLLLFSGASVNIKDKFGYTALMYCVELGNMEMVELLIKNKADLKVKYDDGTTLIKMAIKRNHVDVARLLAEKGVEIDPASAKFLEKEQ